MTTAREALEMAAEVCRALDDKSCARFPAYASGARECASRILALRSSVQEEPSSEPVAEVIEISDTMDSYTQRPPATRTIAPYKPISELPVGTKLYASTLPQSAQNNEGSLPARQPVGADVASASDPSPESAQNNAEAQHEVGNTQPEHGAAVSGPAAASAPFARNDTQRSGAKAPTFDELRKLFDKTVAAFSGSMVDYQERVNHGLFKVYELGRLHGRTDKLSSKTLANRAKTPGVHTMSPDNVIEWTIGVLRGIAERHPETRQDCDVEAFIADQLQPTLDDMRSAISETAPPETAKVPAQPPASGAGRLVSITVDGSTHTRTAQEWLDLARAALRADGGTAKVPPLDPTPEMIEAGAQRLVRWETGEEKWPDAWSKLDVRAARNDAERCWRSMWLSAAPSPSVNDNETGGKR